MKKKLDKYVWSRQAWRLPWLLLIPLGLWLPTMAAKKPLFVEWYAQRIYPHISGALGALSSVFPFSLVEFAIYGILLGSVGFLLVYLVLWIAKRIPLTRVASLLLTLAITGGVLLNTFYVVWGFNYARPTLYQLLNLPVQERMVEDLQELCLDLAYRASTLRGQVAENENGVFYLPEGWRANFNKLPDAYVALGEEIPLFSRKTYPAKGVAASEAMSYAGLAGIYIPFTGEANVNIQAPALLLLSSAAHETAHYLGVAKEDEANFVAYLACSASSDPSVAYSGVMLALTHCGNKLYAADPKKFIAVQQHYSEGMIRDIRDNNAYWDAYEGPIKEQVNDVNDAYLKHNQQSGGVKSYGMMVDLALAWHFEQGKAA